ncbi:MAG TPA: MBL fold metallo-hydrolase, partial [Patescibacteria group bacterium]|nr:MBL fold metallo-hydrolase [Patescibacteria group bacterium]
LARAADLLLIEASTPDGTHLEGHLTPSEAGQIASLSAARRVVMTHFNPVCDGVDMLGQLRRVYDDSMGEARMAEDGMRISI